MRRRYQAIPRLESMEDRLVQSTSSANPYSTAAAELRRLGPHIHQGWSSLVHDINNWTQQSQANSVAASRWATHARHFHHLSGNLFGIPGIKL
jgi:hypothetical protein